MRPGLLLDGIFRTQIGEYRMQIPQPDPASDASPRGLSIRSGDLVRIRRQRWRVVDIRLYETCQLVAVQGAGAANLGTDQRFLLPFETIDLCNPPTSLRVVRPRRWRRACRALLADHAPAAGLKTARLARIDVLSHQLEPALAIVRGLGSRLLLADDVGLGKTIQAGLVMKELQARGAADRFLILTPAGLRDQWAVELSERFGIDATVVDFHEVRQRMANLPVGLNPWLTVPVAVASIDYVKRPEVLSSVISCRWDLVAVDEAHGTARDSDRRSAVAALASRAAYVLLLTATPHDGDTRAFNSLCGIGAYADPLLVFKRTRADVSLGTRRRVHCLRVRPSAAEIRMHAILDRFSHAVRAERTWDAVWLALAVFHKRALSSPRSLEQSIDRRLATFTAGQRNNELVQPALPLTDPDDADPADEPPDWIAGRGLNDIVREEQLLGAVATAARNAAVCETKFAAILRLLRRITEPVIIFTEYRDTLHHLREAIGQRVSMLHGGLTRAERTAALDEFSSGRSRILLATDAAGEGLNLHQRCRIVVNLELPWNPMRLEQRIGRVDRIGQHRTVHVFHLIARETGEERILDRLRSRIARARQEIVVPDPTANEERATAKLVMGEPVENDELAERIVEPIGDALEASRTTLRLEHQAAAEARRLAVARSISQQSDESVRAALEASGAWITTTKLRETRARLGSRLLTILRVESEDGHGRVCGCAIVPLAIALPGSQRRLNTGDTRALLGAVSTELRSRAEGAAARHYEEIAASTRALTEARLRRDRAILQALLNSPPVPLQPGLFDRRTEYEQLATRAALEEAAGEVARRLDAANRASMLRARPARLLLVLTP